MRSTERVENPMVIDSLWDWNPYDYQYDVEEDEDEDDS